MKKLILTSVLSLATIYIFAQAKVWSGGGITIGNTSAAPHGNCKVQFFGNTVFTSTSGSTTSSAYIRGLNAYGTVTTPDYTWKGDSTTGFVHLANNVIGFTIAGAEKMRLHSNGFLGLGATAPTSLLSVGGNGNSLYTGYFYNSATSNGVVGAYATAATPGNGGYASYGFRSSITSGVGYVYGLSASSYNATGLSGRAYGVYGQAGGSTDGYNCGLYGQLVGNMLGTGIYGADASNSTQQNVPGQFAGYFAGKIRTTNDVPEKPTAGSWTGYSDIRLKKDTASFKDGLEVLRKIHPITYKFTGAGNLPAQSTYIGVSAQHIETIAPYCVSKGKLIVTQAESSKFGADVLTNLPADSSGVTRTIVNAKTFNYDPLIYILINSLQQLDSTVTALKKQLIGVTGSGLRTTQGGNNGDGSEENTNGKNDRKGNDNSSLVAKLFPNVPNPFSQSTIIKCFIPDASKSASLLIFDLTGALKKTISINGKGEGNVTINGKELIAGMYNYSLIVDGQEIDTKKMILTEQ